MSVFYDISINTVFKSTKKNPRNSEASVIELNDKSLLMAWQCFDGGERGSEDDAPSSIRLVNSYGNGKTWENERIIAEMKDGCVNCYSPAFFRAIDGSIVLIFKRYVQLIWGKPVLNNCYRITSYDEGKTWSEEEVIWESKNTGIINHGIVRISDGSLLIPVEISCPTDSGVDHNCVAVLRSEDELKTFTMSNILDAPKRGLMEPSLAEANDGSINMVMRTQLGNVYYSKSSDGGRSFSEAKPTVLESPESCPYILSVPDTDVQLVIWNNSKYDVNFGHFGKRSPLTIAISRDGLKTFTDYFDIETAPDHAFTNPTVTVISNGLYVLNYWTLKYTEDWKMTGLIDLKIATFRLKI